MAWVKVYEAVIGPKLRTLANDIGCSQNEALGILVRLWVWGIRNVNAAGEIIGGSEADIEAVIQTGLDNRYSSKTVIRAMKDSGWLDVEDGRIGLHDWGEWQAQWYKDAERRGKDAERKRAERARKNPLLLQKPFPRHRTLKGLKNSGMPTHGRSVKGKRTINIVRVSTMDGEKMSCLRPP